MSELRGLGAVQDEMRRIGGRLLTITVDTPEQSAKVVNRQLLNFPILSDADRKIILTYGVVHAGGGPDGGDVAIPAFFLVNGEGEIVWRRVAKRVQDRPNPQDVIAEIRKLGA